MMSSDGWHLASKQVWPRHKHAIQQILAEYSTFSYNNILLVKGCLFHLLSRRKLAINCKLHETWADYISTRNKSRGQMLKIYRNTYFLVCYHFVNSNKLSNLLSLTYRKHKKIIKMKPHFPRNHNPSSPPIRVIIYCHKSLVNLYFKNCSYSWLSPTKYRIIQWMVNSQPQWHTASFWLRFMYGLVLVSHNQT